MSKDLDLETAQRILTSKERPQARDGVVVVGDDRLEPVGIDADDACELVGLLQDLQRAQGVRDDDHPDNHVPSDDGSAP